MRLFEFAFLVIILGKLMAHRQYYSVTVLFFVFTCFFSDVWAEQLNNGRDLDATTKFANPQAVDIYGLPNGAGGTPISTEEPFVSRDGRFLFFNTGEHENNKDLHYAEWIRTRWVYRGQIGPNVNNAKDVQGNPTMDSSYNFFYIDSGTETMVRMGRFSPDKGELTSIREFKGVPKREVKLIAQKVSGNMGVEVSVNGRVIYFSRATWDLNGLALGRLLGSDIFFATERDGKYVYDDLEAQRIMRHINTSDLEYAASISSDGLELFFTRLSLADLTSGKIRSKIMRSTRASLSETFSKPIQIEAIGSSDFVEGPAISGDAKELYYHKREGDKFRLYKVICGYQVHFW
jgi:hypothetical protein